MGTNYYLRRVRPRLVHDEYHIAKQSSGWRIHFQDSEPYRYDESEAPSYHSVRDIRALLESGEYRLSNEYGDAWEPGTDSLREFDELLRWNGGKDFTEPPVEYRGSYSAPPNVPYDHAGDYRDPDGYAFHSSEFS